MCGLCGLVHADPARPVDERALVAMRDALAHRGPDDAGTYREPGVGLGSRRLAILDLSARGHMPMASADGRYHVAYNGEVYNFAALRAAVGGERAFRSDTDTEVLLRLYEAEGPRMLERLNGMFAIAIWDALDRTLFLARDRLGVKPLYYADDGATLRFASEQKALFAAGVPARFDPGTWDELLCFRYVAGERTPFDGVRRLLPGHYLLWQGGRSRIVRWWHLGERAAERREAWRTSPGDPVGWYRDTFDDAVALRRISDVPVGVLLSGGLDSGSVAASLARQAGDGVASFTVGFDDPAYDERSLAADVAERWSLTRHTVSLDERDLLQRLLDATWLNDEPLAHGNEPHLLAISEHARPRVTVLLSGEGADETLGGYVRYQPLRHARLLAAARPAIPALARWTGHPRLRKLARVAGLDARAAVLFNACDVLPADLAALGVAGHARFDYRERVLDEARAAHPDAVRQAMYGDQHTFLCSLLDRNDRMTMGASIECRVPFLDYRLVEGLAGLPTARLLPGLASKPLLRRALADRLPPRVRRGRKWGFGVPWLRYLRTVPELRDLVADLADVAPVRDGPFDARQVRRVAQGFLAGSDAHGALVRQLVMVAVWHAACVAAPRTAAAAPRRAVRA